MSTFIALSFDSDMNRVPLIGVVIHSVCNSYGMIDKESAMVELALVEAINNVIEHAYNMQNNQCVKVELNLLIDSIVFKVFDEGANLSSIEMMALFEQNHDALPNDLPIGGWGLGLIYNIMDEVTYDSKNGTNCMTLVKKISDQNASNT